MVFKRWNICANWQSRIIRFSWGPVLVILILVLASLQVLHMTLLSRLEARKATLDKVQTLKVLQEESVKLFYATKSAIETSQIVDSAGEYKIVNFLYGSDTNNKQASTNNKHEKEVTLITQCSVNRLYHLIELTDRWHGPISVTVFNPDNNMAHLLELLLGLYECVPTIHPNVTIHLVYPLVQASLSLPENPDQFRHSCGDLPAVFKQKLNSQRNYAMKYVKYPNNLLRNVALSNAKTGYVFVVDIDMLPNAGLYQNFNNFIQKHFQPSSSSQNLGAQTVYVVPAFEVSYKTPSPMDKPALLKLWQQQLLRPFYHELCWRCHKPTDYTTWRNMSSPEGALQVAYEVEWKDPWEPFYIGPNTVPRYDTRFKQYGFNRISQVTLYMSILLLCVGWLVPGS